WRHPYGRAHQAASARRSPDAKSCIGEIEAVGVAELTEEGQIVAGSAAAIEQAQVRPPSRRAPQQRRHEVAEATEPEMPRLRIGGSPQQMLHWRDCIVS